MGRAVLGVGWTILWIIPIVASLQLSVGWATLALIALTALFLWRNVVRPSRSRSRLAAVFRLRPWRHFGWLTVATIAQFLLTFATFVMHEQLANWRLVPQLPDSPDFIPPEFYTHPLGPVAIFIGAALLTPLAEEFGFRGRMQYRLENAFGVVPAILATAIVFSVLHGALVGIHHLPFAFFVGWLAWRTGSIWPGVYMHAINNGAAIALMYIARGTTLDDEMPAGFWPIAAATALVALGVFLESARRIDRIVARQRRALRTRSPRSTPENAFAATL